MKRLLALVVTLLAAVAILVPATAAGASGICPTSDSPSLYTGTQLDSSMGTVIGALYNVGYHNDADLLAGLAIGVAESSLWTQARNWHPEYGCRPASDYIGVQGPNAVWSSDHTQQLNSDRGIWQISSHWWPQYNDHITDSVGYAAGAVWDIQHIGGWAEWDTYDSGAAQAHYDASVDGWPALRPVVTYWCSFHACT